MPGAKSKTARGAAQTPKRGATSTAAAFRPVIQSNPAILRQLQAEGRAKSPKMTKEERLARMPVQSRGTSQDKGKQRAPAPAIDLTNEDDDEDDLEEVEIPSAAGPSSPYPGTPTTPGTNLTRATNTPGTMTAEDTAEEEDEDEDGYGGYTNEEDEDNAGVDPGVLTLQLDGETDEQRQKRIALAMRKKPMTSKDRAIRLEIHKMHVIALLAAARIRNRWCCNNLLKARLLSLLPHPLHSAFNIPPSRFPDRAQRSRLFFDALQSLVSWWSQSFFDISDATLGQRTRPWDEVQEVVKTLPKLTRADLFGEGFEKASDWTEAMDKLAEGGGGEKLRSVNSLMKKVLQQEGSRDISAQLFVSLARACGLGARLVVSLQPVPWRAEKVVVKKKSGAGRKGRTLASRQGDGEPSNDEDDSEDDLEEVPIPDPNESHGAPGEVMGKMKAKKGGVRAAGKRRLQDPADMYRLKKPAVQKVGTAPKPKKRKEDLSNQSPVFWAEVFSRSDQRWTPVDPVLGIIRKKSHYEPASDSGPIRMLYVVAFEEDGFARDVTLRYTKNFGAKTVKLRPPARKDESEWWTSVMGFLERPYRLNRDDLEDAELETSQVSEGMPLHMTGFKDHPIYVLERHLKREEVIQPKREIGKFKGEPVYRRANVLSCKTAENWMRSGRRVKERQEPMKWVKQRAVTLNKRRAQELSMQESGEAIMQGLYAENQTEIYRPPPIEDGIIPQNSFGNIDLYAPTMLPEGAIHLPYKGIAKVAKTLGISYAEACTGFEFKKQRAIPVITGIVVANENEQLVMDAYEESAAAAEERERAKRVEKALKRWVKLINGLRVRARLQAEYGTGETLEEQQKNPLADLPTGQPKDKPRKSAETVIAEVTKAAQESWSSKVNDKSPSVEPIVLDDEDEEEEELDEVDVSPTDHQAESKPVTNGNTMIRIPRPAPVEPVPDHDVIAVDFADNEASPPTRASRKGGKNATNGRRKSVRTPKRSAPSLAESEAESSDAEIATRSTRKKAKRAAPVPTTTRSLRSRASKTEEQIKEEEAAKERIRQAMASDEEMTEGEE